MYNEQIISSRLSNSNYFPSLTYKSKQYQLPLQRYDLKYRLQMKDYLDSLIDMDIYNETIEKKKDEVRIIFVSSTAEREFNSKEISEFIVNEQSVCTLDCNYFMDGYYLISDRHNKFINFSPNKLQLINRNIRSRLELARVAIKKLTLKARQTGETTDGLGVLLHRLNFIKDAKSVIASYRLTETVKLTRMFNDGFNRIPYWLKEKYVEMDSKDHYKYSNNSVLTLGYGTEKAIGRGATLTLFHLTEIAKFLYPAESVESALSKASHESVWTLGTIEGTAEKMGDWFDEFWHIQNKLQNEGLADFYCSFIPYVCRGDDLYPTTEWINKRKEAFEKWKPKQETIRHKFKVENYIKTHKDLLEVMGSNWQMSKETMFYYEVEKEKYKSRNQLHLFYREMPSDPEEAFQTAEKGIYPIEIITLLNDKAQEQIPSLYKIKGNRDEINETLQIQVDDELDFTKSIINTQTPYNWNYKTSFELQPIKFNGWDKLDYKNTFIIFDEPNGSFDYTLGGDFSDGLGENLSDDFVIEIVRKGTIANKDKQVLEFASPEINSSNSWPFLLAAGLLFSPANQLLMSLEAERGGGQEAIDKLLMMGWNNMFELIDITKTGDTKNFGRLGWFTNRRTRPIMVNHFNSFVKGNHLEIMSPLLIKEMKGLIKRQTVSSQYQTETEKILGKIDNRWIATCIALYSSHQNEMLGFEKAAWEKRQVQDNNIITLAKHDYAEDFNNISKESSDIINYIDYNNREDWDDLAF